MRNPLLIQAALAALLLAGPPLRAKADVITDWNLKAGDIVVESRLGTPPAIRVMALVQTAVSDAVRSLRLPAGTAQPSLEAAVAAANRATLAKLIPAQQASIDAAYHAALQTIGDGPAKDAGIASGERAAAAVLAARANDGASGSETYRPHTTAGMYVPTVTPAVSHWLQRKPWLMSSAAQFRPAPPPALGSEAWARDYN